MPIILDRLKEIVSAHKVLAIILTLMVIIGTSGVVYAVMTSNKISGETTVQTLVITGAVPTTAMVGTPMTFDLTYANIPQGNPSGSIHISITNTTLGASSLDGSLISVAITKGGTTTTLTPSVVGNKATYSLSTSFLSSGGLYQVSITYQDGVNNESKYLTENWITIP